MFQALALFLVLTLSTSLANGQRTTYSIINMTDAIPYDETCAETTCANNLHVGLTIISMSFGTLLKTIPFTTDICQCQLEGLHDFTFTYKCFISPEKDFVDRHVVLTFPHFAASCECDLSNNASKTAEKVNAGKIVEGKCGKENYKNTLHPQPLKCEGSQGGDGDSHVSLKLDLAGTELPIIIRVDNTKSTKFDSFPIQLSVITANPVQITHKGPPEFNEAWKCLAGNMDNFFSHLAENAPVPFFECLSERENANIVNALINSFGKC